MRQVTSKTLRQMEKFKCLGVVFTTEEGGAWRLIQGFVELKQCCMSSNVLSSLNWSFETPKSCQFSNRFLCRSLPIVMNLG